MNKTLAIIGSHPRTRELFDMTRTDADVWLFNEAISNPVNTWAKRADAVFQMHVPAIWRNPQNRNDPKHLEWLTSQTACTVWMQEEYPDVPAAKRYPIEGVTEMLGEGAHFLTSSVPQAMALAAYLGTYTRIEIYGVAMETNTEYQFQREGTAFWLGFLKGRGIDVYFADPTFEAPLYGYEGKVSVEYEQFVKRIEELTPQLQDMEVQYQAATERTRRAIAAFELDSGLTQEKELYEAVQAQASMSDQFGIAGGALQENQRYKGKADTMREASGGEFVFSRQEFESAAKSLTDLVSKGVMEINSIQTTMDIIHGNAKRAAKGSPKHRKVMEGYRAYIVKLLNEIQQTAVYKGAAMENGRYMTYLDKHIKAAGGSKSEAVLLERMQNGEMVAA